MAKEIWIGSNSGAKKAKEFYVGINNQARKVKKAYVGANGIAKLFWEEAKKKEGKLVLDYDYVSGKKYDLKISSAKDMIEWAFEKYVEYNDPCNIGTYPGTYTYIKSVLPSIKSTILSNLTSDEQVIFLVFSNNPVIYPNPDHDPSIHSAVINSLDITCYYLATADMKAKYVYRQQKNVNDEYYYSGSVALQEEKIIKFKLHLTGDRQPWVGPWETITEIITTDLSIQKVRIGEMIFYDVDINKYPDSLIYKVLAMNVGAHIE